MFRIVVKGLDNAIRKIEFFRRGLKYYTIEGMTNALYEIRNRVFQKNPSLGEKLDVWREGDRVFLAPEVSPELYNEYLKSLTEEERYRTRIIRGKCRWYLYQEPVIRRGVVKEYPVLKYSPSVLQETVEEAINDGTIKEMVVESIKRLL